MTAAFVSCIPSHYPAIRRSELMRRTVLIAYLTPVRGVGCRSGSYLIYGVFGTVAWLCLAGSAILSHCWLLGYQRQHQKTGVFSKFFGTAAAAHTANGAAADKEKYASTLGAASTGAQGSGETRADILESPFYRGVRITAAVLRYFGKMLACVNALWLLSSNLMVYASAFSNCFCQSNYVSLRSTAWVLLFKGATDLQAAALTPWATGVAASIMGTCPFPVLSSHTTY